MEDLEKRSVDLVASLALALVVETTVDRWCSADIGQFTAL